MSPGSRAGHLAGPHPALPRPRPCLTRHTRCGRARARARPRPCAPLRPCSDPRTRPFQIVQTRATHSVRRSLGPTPVSLSDPTVRDAGLMMGPMAGGGRVVTTSAPVRTWPTLATGRPSLTHGTGLYMLCTVPCTLYCHVTWHWPSHCLQAPPLGPDTHCPFPGPSLTLSDHRAPIPAAIMLPSPPA